MGDEERINQEGPLSREGWIMFLSGQITNLMNEGDKKSSVFFPIISLFVVAGAFLTNSAFSTASANIQLVDKVKIIQILEIAINLLSIFFIIFIIAIVYENIKFYTITKNNVERLKDIRNDIINERLTDTNEIRERWRNVMQANYTEIYKLDFLNLRFSISRKAQRRH
jgi:predicted membrane protein